MIIISLIIIIECQSSQIEGSGSVTVCNLRIYHVLLLKVNIVIYEFMNEPFISCNFAFIQIPCF